MTQILNLSGITNSLTTNTSTVYQFRNISDSMPKSLALIAKFTGASGGTSVDAWVQTTLDGGGSWFDIANFHFTTNTTNSIGNLSSLTPVTTLYTPTDSAMSANTVKDGLIGRQIRVKYTSAGTYNTNSGAALTIDADGNNRLTPIVQSN